MVKIAFKLHIGGASKPRDDRVELTDDLSIFELRERIYAKNSNGLSHTDPSALSVYMPDTSLPPTVDPLENLDDVVDASNKKLLINNPLVVLADGKEEKEQSSDDELPEAKEWESITACARLGKDFLERNNLVDYTTAAAACLEEDSSLYLKIIFELLKLQDENEDGIGCFAAIFASSGTGKTQLAATASIDEQVKSGATVLYVNMSQPGTQRFYTPHDLLGITLLCALKSFKTSLKHYAASASTISKWSGQSKFCGFLYCLLFNELPGGDGNETSLSAIRTAILAKRRRFLFFVDEVPSKQEDDFNVVLFFRDLLRSIGICPILMSTHTGAENYVEKVSRGGNFTWVRIITRLPPFKFQKNEALDIKHEEVFEESERPLVTGLAASSFKEGSKLAAVVSQLRGVIQGTKSDPWYKSPSLQLMQLFATKLEFGNGIYKNVHHIVGKHFGSIAVEEPIRLTPDTAKTFKQTAKMSFVNGELEPLLYLALVSWDDSCLSSTPGQPRFPLSSEGSPISVMKAFKLSQDLFAPWICAKNDKVNQSDGDLLEVLAHASLTLASLKTDCFGDKFLGGVPLQMALCFVSKLMMSEAVFDGVADLPDVLKPEQLQYDWFTVPALGGSNSSLSKKLNKVAGTKIGFLERPENKEQTDGFIYNTDEDGNKTSRDTMVECKNRRGGLTSTDLNGIFHRIPEETKCCLIFTTGLNGKLYEKTDYSTFERSMNNMPHEAFGKGEASVVTWNTNTNKADFFGYSLEDQDYTLWKADEGTKTALLVVIFFVDLVEVVSPVAVKKPNSKKRKWDITRDDLGALLLQKK